MTEQILYLFIFSACVAFIGIAWFYQKRLSWQLKQSRDSLAFALQSGRMGTWDINLETDTVSCSPEMLALWNISPSEFQGHRPVLQAKVHPDDLQTMTKAINTAIQNDQIYEFEYRIIPSPGVTRWVLSRGRCTYDMNKKPIRFSGVICDITEKKIKEDERAAVMKIRDQFFLIAGHELRTPLTCMQLQFQVSEWDLRNNPEVFTIERIESGLKKQQQHLKRITRIVENILDESKIAAGRFHMQFEEFDLSEMVADVLEEFKVIAKSSDVEIHVIASETIVGYWDRFRLEQVLLNLLINAVRYGHKKPIQVEVKREDNFACFIVRDKGIGIQPEDQSRIFERFERANTDLDVNGIGLGLYISNNIVSAHGGKIRLKSEFGKGSEFTVLLPGKSL